MDAAVDNMLADPEKALDLSNIRYQLIRLEDTIIFHLIERVQFPLNENVYDAKALPIPCYNTQMPATLSLFDHFLYETERFHSTIRRYDSPDEYPFFPNVLQRPMLPALKYPRILHPNDVNVNEIIKTKYIREVLPAACRKFDREDRGVQGENYGSTTVCDANCLQALSRRIHYGKFVAESKFKSDPERFVKLIKAGDAQGIDDAITVAAVEKKVLERLRRKARTYGTDPDEPGQEDGSAPSKIDADAVVKIYEQVVIPLTKKVEVDYLMQRLKGTEWE